MRDVAPTARAIGAIALALVVLVGASALVERASSSASPTSAPVVISGTEPGSVEVAPAYTPTDDVVEQRAMAPTTPLEVLVGLSPTDPTGFEAYAQAVYVDGSPLYHQFLTTAEFVQRFGPSAASVAAAQQYFVGYGLRASVSSDRLLLAVDGTAAQVGAAFHTSFTEYTTATGRIFFDHPTAAYLPALASWSGVLGLGNSTPIDPDVSSASSAAAGSDVGSCSGGSAGLVPCQVWGAYDMAGLIDGGTNGTGATIGIVDTYDGAQSQDELADDLASFDTEYDLPTPDVHWVYAIPTTENLNSTSTGWGLEESLDLEWSHAAAPGASIDFAFSPDSGPGLYASVDWLVDHQAVNVISLSWGEPDVGIFNAYSGPCPNACNASTDGSYDLLDPVLELAAAEGISVFAASGDCGSADGTSGVSTNFPASDPYVTGVGGTTLDVSANGTYVSEVAWSGNSTGAVSPGCHNQGGSGGGWSPGARPWWQSGEGLTGEPALRGVPDVSLDAGTPVSIVYSDGNSEVLGTSVSTPVWAGIAALADQYAGQSLGFLDPQLYQILAGSDYTSAFHEITSGSNGYSAGPGWNPVTGIGTPRVGELVTLLARQAFPESDLTTRLVAQPGYGSAPLDVAFSVSVTGGSGSYPLEGVAFGDGNASSAVDGNVSHVYPRPGVYAAAAYSADSSGNTSLSPAIAIVVGGGTSLNVTISASDTAPSLDSAVTLTAAVSGGVAPYSYYFQFGDGSTANWSSADSVAHTYDATGSFCAEVLVQDSADPVDGGTSEPVEVDVGGAAPTSCAVTVPIAPLAVTGGPSATSGTAPLAVDFTAVARGDEGGPYTYAWTFGDGTSSSAENASHTYASAGTYTAELKVTGPTENVTENWTISVARAPTPIPTSVVDLVLGGAVAAGVAAVAIGFWIRRSGARPPSP